MAKLKGQVALVSGASRGIGKAIALELAGEGASLYLAADGTEAELRAACSECSERHDAVDARYGIMELSEADAGERMVAACLETFGRLDVLVNNAGVVILGDVESLSLEDWRRVHAVNLDGVFLGCRHGVEAMKRGGGSIVNLSSVSGLVGGHNLAAYNSSKGGVRLLTKSVALHCARAGYGIRCNSVHPAFIETAMVRSMVEASDDPERTRRTLARQIPLGGIGEPDDVAHMIVYLASDESKFVTGAEFVVDGGVTAR